MARTGKKAEPAKEKTLFPGNNFTAPAVMAAFIVCFVLCFTSARDKAASEAMRWQKEAKYEVSRLECTNQVELEACVMEAQ